jgi:hypothetical protein
MNYNLGHRRNRLRKKKKGWTSSFRQKPQYNTLKVLHNSTFKSRRNIPEWGALYKAWVAFTIAKNQYDYEKMRKYATVIRKFQRRLNIEISDFPDIGISGFEEDFENKVEDDDSGLVTVDPWGIDRED